MLSISEKDSCNDQGRFCEGKFRCSWYPGFDGMPQRKPRRIENRRERSVGKSTGWFRWNYEVAYSKCAIMGSRWGWPGPMGIAGWAKLPVDAAPAGSTQFSSRGKGIWKLQRTIMLQTEEKRLKVKIAEMAIQEIRFRIQALNEDIRHADELHELQLALATAQAVNQIEYANTIAQKRIHRDTVIRSQWFRYFFSFSFFFVFITCASHSIFREKPDNLISRSSEVFFCLSNVNTIIAKKNIFHRNIFST